MHALLSALFHYYLEKRQGWKVLYIYWKASTCIFTDISLGELQYIASHHGLAVFAAVGGSDGIMPYPHANLQENRACWEKKVSRVHAA